MEFREYKNKTFENIWTYPMFSAEYKICQMNEMKRRKMDGLIYRWVFSFFAYLSISLIVDEWWIGGSAKD